MSIDDPIDSPFNSLLGFTISDWRPDRVTLVQPIRPELLNRSDTLHGGVLTALIDAAGGFSGCYCDVPGNVRRAMTLTMSASFLGQARAGDVRVEARRRGGGRKVFFASVEVFDAQGELIALGEGTYRYRAGSETSAGQPVDAASS